MVRLMVYTAELVMIRSMLPISEVDGKNPKDQPVGDAGGPHANGQSKGDRCSCDLP